MAFTKMYEKYSLFGIPVTSISKPDIELIVDNSINDHKQQIIFGYSLSTIGKLRNNPEIYNLSKDFNIFLPDGRNFYLIARLFGIKLKSDISIPRFTLSALNIANKKRYKILLFGSSKDTNKNATENIKKKYQNINVLDGIDGYYEDCDDQSIVTQINTADPDILLVGMSSPKKEKFVNRYKDNLSPPLIILCGGMIDVLAEKTRITPLPLKKIGLAWLFRSIQEPRRLFPVYFKNILSLILIAFRFISSIISDFDYTFIKSTIQKD